MGDTDVHLLAERFVAPLRAMAKRLPNEVASEYRLDVGADAATQAEWLKAFDRLRGREIFPADRNSLIHAPLELIGVAYSRICRGIELDPLYVDVVIRRYEAMTGTRAVRIEAPPEP
ncbi:hypothetical protein [Enterovirga rhinocerotis]|uniref:hypothetical protein n=1 Tax=Enterovirga rhinocerotis TaxID=1339210 RepID=UPI00105C5CFD|nr:hypothetical protein [Enterovirga rhinocerotis]